MASAPEEKKPAIKPASKEDVDIDGSRVETGGGMVDPRALLRKKMMRGGKSGSSGSLQARSPGKARPGRQKNILYVEDVRVSQRVVKLALTRAKYKVTTVASAEEALVKWKRSKYQIVLMDINLGKDKMTGVEATTEMRSFEEEKGISPKTTIIGLTGSLDDSDIETYRECGMDGVIEKGNLLVQSVKEALEQHNKRPNEFILHRVE